MCLFWGCKIDTKMFIYSYSIIFDNYPSDGHIITICYCLVVITSLHTVGHLGLSMISLDCSFSRVE